MCVWLVFGNACYYYYCIHRCCTSARCLVCARTIISISISDTVYTTYSRNSNWPYCTAEEATPAYHFHFPQLAGGFYPQRSSSGRAVVTGVVPSPPRYVPSFLSRIGSSIPTARQFSSNVFTLLRFPLILFYARKSPYECALGET